MPAQPHVHGLREKIRSNAMRRLSKDGIANLRKLASSLAAHLSAWHSNSCRSRLKKTFCKTITQMNVVLHASYSQILSSMLTQV